MSSTRQPMKRIGSLERARSGGLQLHEQTCVFCNTTGGLKRDADYYYHTRRHAHVDVAYIHAVHGSVWCDFCQREQPGTEVHSETECQEILANTAGGKR